MANTGYIINNTVRQNFTTGPNSGSAVTGSIFDVDLTVAPFSASLDGIGYYNRAYEPDLCEPGFDTCIVPLLTSIITGSSKGRFDINYVTQSSFNTPINITASVSNTPNFLVSESFYADIDGIIPVTSSFVSGTVYFKAFISCSGPDPSPLSDPLSFTYNIIPPPSEVGNVFIIFKNNYSSAMEVNIRSLRGNTDYIIPTRQSVTYDYRTPGGKSEELNITIKGGAKNVYGNYVLRSTKGNSELTYTTGDGFTRPSSRTQDSSKFVADQGLSFKVRQLLIPPSDSTTTTTFTLLQSTPPVTVSPTLSPTSIFGSVPYSTQNEVCSNSKINFREKNYYKLDNYIYNSLSDAQSNTKPIFPYSENYILTSVSNFLIVNKEGRIQNSGTCVLPSLDIFTLVGPYSTQEEACARSKTSGGSSTYEYKDNTLVSGFGLNKSGRYPLYRGVTERGGRNVILSSGRIIGYETCGSELSTISFSNLLLESKGYTLSNLSNMDPFLLSKACAYNTFSSFLQGPSGIIYYGGSNIYVPLGLGNGWRKTRNGDFVKLNKGIIIDRVDPC